MIYIVTVNFNSKKIIDFIQEFNKNSKNNYKLVIVNNSPISWDLSKEYKNIRFIINTENIGFARACNQGISYALKRKARRILIVNPDTSFKFNELAPLVQSSLDISGPILVYKKENIRIFDKGGKVNKFIGRASHLETKQNYKKFIGHTLTDFVSGAFMLINSDVFKEIGLFDERYFLYYEDVDLCIRAKQKGFTIGVCNDVIVKHELGEVAGRNSFVKHFHNLRSNLIFINSHVSNMFKPVAFTYWAVLLTWVAIKYTFRKFS